MTFEKSYINLSFICSLYAIPKRAQKGKFLTFLFFISLIFFVYNISCYIFSYQYGKSTLLVIIVEINSTERDQQWLNSKNLNFHLLIFHDSFIQWVLMQFLAKLSSLMDHLKNLVILLWIGHKFRNFIYFKSIFNTWNSKRRPNVQNAVGAA